MGGRIEELRRLRDGLGARDRAALDAARRVAQALRGSGGTFGFPELTAVGALVESAPDDATLRRVEGLIEYLHRLRRADGSRPTIHAEWLCKAADVVPDGPFADLTTAWDEVGRRGGLATRALAERAASRLGLGVADLSRPARSGLRLVPEALMREALLLPIAEDGETLTLAAADPTHLTVELELTRLTGRRPVFTIAAPDDLERAFVALLDVAAEGPAPRRRVAPDSSDSAAKVLVVDDDPSARMLARKVLEKNGYHVVDAGNGLEALERLEAEDAVTLVVADLNMPVLDGLELIWEMRDDETWAHIPIIVLTGETDDLLEAKLIEEGADDYLSKPLDPRTFVARVGATLRRAEL